MSSVVSKVEEEKLFRCDLCSQASNAGDDTVSFGEWMSHGTMRVHHFCLLLSTYLPQRGKVGRIGIHGYLLSDILNEIHAANSRICCYCHKRNAHIECHRCKKFFHMVCGRSANCLFQFVGEFHSYCGNCLPVTEFQRFQKLLASYGVCYICSRRMGRYVPNQFVYAECCTNAYVHRHCMQKYALAAGFYLRCIWCRNTDFRDHVRRLGVFVPDREPQWDLYGGAYRILHRLYPRCGMQPCKCPHGRFHSDNLQWPLVMCNLCQLLGAHNPGCLPGLGASDPPIPIFKCTTCAQTEQKLRQQHLLMAEDADTSPVIYQHDPNPTPGVSELENAAIEEVLSSLLLSMDEPRKGEEERVTPTAPPSGDITASEKNEVPACSLNESSPKNSPVPEATFTFTLFRFNQQKQCVGTSIVRVDQNSSRFRGKTLQEIESNAELLQREDIVSSSDDKGIFTEIDRVIEEISHQ